MLFITSLYLVLSHIIERYRSEVAHFQGGYYHRGKEGRKETMENRYTRLVPDSVRRAFEEIYAYGANDEKYEGFAGKWGGLTTENFQEALENGEGDDRLCAMFVLSASSLPDAATLLLPFLQSDRREERCVSAIALGMRKDERAFPYLEALLLEGLSIDERMHASERKDHQVLEGIFVCDKFRPKAVQLLEPWHSPTVEQTMVQAIKALWALENSPAHFFSGGYYFETLIYALGQKGLFTALDEVGFAPSYHTIALVYLALGHFQIQAQPTLMRAVLRSQELRQRIGQFLENTFGLSGEQTERCIEAFYRESLVRRSYREHQNETEMLATPPVIEELEDPNLVDAFEEQKEQQEREEESIEEREPTCVCVYRGHSLLIWSLAWSPDGTQIVSAGADATAQVWKSQTGEQTGIFTGHEASVNVVAWSPDGQWIASGGSDNRVFLWEARSGERVRVYTKQSAWIYSGLAWSPDGALLASASWDGTVHIWEALTGKTRVIYRGHQGVVTAVAWSPDGTHIVSGGGYPECAVHVWNATTGQLTLLYKAHMEDVEKVRPLSPVVLDRDEAWGRGPSSVRSLAWSPDGRWIASVGLRGVLRVWNAHTGEDLIARDQNRTSGPLAWSAESRNLITATRIGVDVWDIEQKRVMINYTPVNRYEVTALGCSPDRTLLAAGGEYPSVCVWRAGV